MACLLLLTLLISYLRIKDELYHGFFLSTERKSHGKRQV